MKQKKSKPKKPQTKNSKHGKQADLAQFRSQLDDLGLKIIQVTADGNCFFRAIADQLEGNEEEHAKYRNTVVQYILTHREDFEPFIEDEVPFDEYCKSMEKDGTWAGNLELQAASLVTRRNICIHQANSPRWYISNFSGGETTMIHLSYHDGEHYNSIRLVDDACEGPSKPIIIKVDANISVVDHKRKDASNGSKVSSHRNGFDSGSVKLVMAGTGCANMKKVEQILQEVNGDADAAIEFLIAEQQADVNADESDGIPCQTIGDDKNGNDENDNSERPEVSTGDAKCEHNHSRGDFQSVQCHSNDKEEETNEECSCGSKKKYKACCGSTVGKSSKAPIISSTNRRPARKGKKEIKRTKKKEATRGIQKCQSGILTDVGALCI
ncbi:uncharacterized protein A4U43_UnF8250 [Asparagus officinalis]|uniref:OTU domain-containing protein n=1 Tax=Asparagus officinalis TaxID=4686 RepID=A0A1R3L5Z8_ASPOF|nr:OTU domain-containing protein 3 isoform X2 [Asparagus officinalis]ONK55042.1 uncharacterized protein A4U43_UnF8250 [Asparagus officinalis]